MIWRLNQARRLVRRNYFFVLAPSLLQIHKEAKSKAADEQISGITIVLIVLLTKTRMNVY